MDDGSEFVSHNFLCFGMAKIDIFGSLFCEGDCPEDSGLIVVLDDRGIGCFGHTEVGGAMLDMEKLEETFVGGHDLGLAGDLWGSFPAD